MIHLLSDGGRKDDNISLDGADSPNERVSLTPCKYTQCLSSACLCIVGRNSWPCIEMENST